MDIGQFLNWIRLSPKYLLALALAAVFLLLMPEDIAESIGLQKFITEQKPWIGLVALVSVALLSAHGLVWLGCFGKDFYKSRKLQKAWKANLKDLTPEEKDILARYILNQTKSRKLDPQSGIVNGLCDSGIIYPAGKFGTLYGGLAYNLQPWAWQELKKHPEYLEPVISQLRREIELQNKVRKGER